MAAVGGDWGKEEAFLLPDGEDVVPERPQDMWVSSIVAPLGPNPSSAPHSPSKRKMQHISNLSIAVMYVMYFLAALFGYLTFYGMAGPWGRRQRPGWGARGWPVATAPCVLEALIRRAMPNGALQLWR